MSKSLLIGYIISSLIIGFIIGWSVKPQNKIISNEPPKERELLPAELKEKTFKKAIEKCFENGGVPVLNITNNGLKDCKFK